MKVGGLFVSLLFFLISCTSRPVTPTRDSRRAIDTIYKNNVMLIQPKIDSLCTQLYDSVYTAAVDSIMHEREAEMNALTQ